MYIEKVILNNFRNYEEQIVEFNKNINVIYGDNAQGKTNILEAIFLSAFGKSFRTSKEKELIKLDKEFLNVSTFYKKSDREGKIQINISNKKEVKLNGVKLKKLSELLGNINLVIFTPDDINILKDGPAKRRRFLDMMIGQLRPNYVYVLNQYLKTIEQRNNYLRQIKEQNVSTEMLDIWNEKLAEYAIKIFEYRYEFIEKLKSKINNIHKNNLIKNSERFLAQSLAKIKSYLAVIESDTLTSLPTYPIVFPSASWNATLTVTFVTSAVFPEGKTVVILSAVILPLPPITFEYPSIAMIVAD